MRLHWNRLLALAGLCLAGLGALAQNRGDACAGDIPPWSTESSGGPTPPMGYCFRNFGKLRVLWLHGGVGGGSARNVLAGLSQVNRYDEVWLNSPGGSVPEAIAIGRSLRRFNAHVRVPTSQRVICVSACTILSMGGYNRTIDPGATFIVHAPSSMMKVSASGPFPWNDKYTWTEALSELRKQPELIDKLAQNVADGEAGLTADLVSYYQAMLEGSPAGSPAGSIHQQLAAGAVPTVYGAAGSPRRLAEDAADVEARGVVALQELFTQVELVAMAAIHEALWKQRAVLGRGAEEALKIFRAGLNCRIQDLCPLERHQLEQLGYHNFTPQ